MDETELYANETMLRTVARIAIHVEELLRQASRAVENSHRLVDGGTAFGTVGALATAETYLDEALVLCRAAKALGRGRP